jgi:hypothetical protein
MDQNRMVKEIRLLKAYALGSSVLLIVLLAAAFQSPRNQRFTVLDVERINIVEPNGRLAMVISDAQHLPGPILEGRELSADLSAGRRGSAGMLFYNARGDEVGGLTFRGQEAAGSHSAGSILAFDQFKQDQVVSVQYSDQGNRRSAGVSVWDRSTTIPIGELVELVQASRGNAGARRDTAVSQLQRMQSDGSLGAQRLFLGSANRTAALRINDTLGRPRIRLYVDSLNVARLEFLDERGRVVHTVPESGR